MVALWGRRRATFALPEVSSRNGSSDCVSLARVPPLLLWLQTPWKRRYFVLDASKRSLHYFKDSSTESLLGTIDLDALADVVRKDTGHRGALPPCVKAGL
jgi:hypothetical protein